MPPRRKHRPKKCPSPMRIPNLLANQQEKSKERPQTEKKVWRANPFQRRCTEIDAACFSPAQVPSCLHPPQARFRIPVAHRPVIFLYSSQKTTPATIGIANTLKYNAIRNRLLAIYSGNQNTSTADHTQPSIPSTINQTAFFHHLRRRQYSSSSISDHLTGR